MVASQAKWIVWHDPWFVLSVTIAVVAFAVLVVSGVPDLAGWLRRLYPQLEEDWLLIADRGFYHWQDWCTAACSGAALLRCCGGSSPTSGCPSWRSSRTAPTGRSWPAGRSRARPGRRSSRPTRAGEGLDPARARHVRVIEYEIPDRDGQARTGWPIKKFVRTARRYCTIQIRAGQHTITAEDPLPPDLRGALALIK